jgi:hypothetical protein
MIPLFLDPDAEPGTPELAGAGFAAEAASATEFFFLFVLVSDCSSTWAPMLSSNSARCCLYESSDIKP